MPGTLESFAFTSAARRRLPAALLRRIEQLNAADQALWEAASAGLDAALAGLGDEWRLPEDIAPQLAAPSTPSGARPRPGLVSDPGFWLGPRIPDRDATPRHDEL